MEDTTIIALSSLGLAFLSLLTSFILNLDKKRIKELKRKNDTLLKCLDHSLNALEGYEFLESKFAKTQNITLKDYRTKIRDEYSAKDFRFLYPRDIKEYKLLIK